MLEFDKLVIEIPEGSPISASNALHLAAQFFGNRVGSASGLGNGRVKFLEVDCYPNGTCSADLGKTIKNLDDLRGFFAKSSIEVVTRENL